jgi:hypothetical protein
MLISGLGADRGGPGHIRIRPIREGFFVPNDEQRAATVTPDRMHKMSRFARMAGIAGNDDGSSAVEFALVLPLFLLMLFGTADFGFVLYTQSIMENAARETARRMAVDNTFTTSQAQAFATDYLSSWPLTFAITPTRPTCGAFTCAQVNITVPVGQAALMGDPFGIFSGNLAAQVTMRQEA